MTDAGGKTEYTKTVHIDPVDLTLTITAQPRDKTAATGEKIVMSVGAAGIGLTYQWQYKSKSASSWSEASGSTAKTADSSSPRRSLHMTSSRK